MFEEKSFLGAVAPSVDGMLGCWEFLTKRSKKYVALSKGVPPKIHANKKPSNFCPICVPVGAFKHFLCSINMWVVILPIDIHWSYFFRGVGLNHQPPLDPLRMASCWNSGPSDPRGPTQSSSGLTVESAHFAGHGWGGLAADAADGLC